MASLIKNYAVKRALLAGIIGLSTLNLASADQEADRHSHTVQVQSLAARVRHREQVVLQYLHNNGLNNQRNQGKVAQASKQHHNNAMSHNSALIATHAHRTAVLNIENQRRASLAASDASAQSSIDQHVEASSAQSARDHWNQVDSSNRLIQNRVALQQQALQANANPEDLTNNPPVDGSDRFLPPLPEGISAVEPMDNPPSPEVPTRQPEPLYPAAGSTPASDRDVMDAPPPSGMSTVEPGTGTDTEGVVDNFANERAKPLRRPKAPARKKHFDPYGGGEYPVAP